MDNLNTVLIYLNSMRDNLTKSEKKIADFILNNAEDVIYMTISEISGSVNVGDTTVLRLCNKIGFTSYQDFKLRLAQELSMKKGSSKIKDYQVKLEDSLEELTKKVLSYDSNVISETLSLLNIDDLKKSKNLIINAKRIQVYGVGASAITCQDIALKFSRIGFNIVSLIEFHAQMMSASLLEEGDLAIGISFSGSSKDTNKLLEIAKAAGANVLCVTHYANSPITKIADVTLLHGGKEDPLGGGNLSSKIAQIAVFDVLYNTVYREIKENALKSVNRTSKSIVETMI